MSVSCPSVTHPVLSSLPRILPALFSLLWFPTGNQCDCPSSQNHPSYSGLTGQWARLRTELEPAHLGNGANRLHLWNIWTALLGFLFLVCSLHICLKYLIRLYKLKKKRHVMQLTGEREPVSQSHCQEWRNSHCHPGEGPLGRMRQDSGWPQCCWYEGGNREDQEAH